VFGVAIRPTGDVPPILGKFVRYLLTKGISTPDIFAVDTGLDKEIANLRKNIIVGAYQYRSPSNHRTRDIDR